MRELYIGWEWVTDGLLYTWDGKHECLYLCEPWNYL